MSSAGCRQHPGENLRFMCLQCTLPICRDCKLTHHEGHPTTDLGLVSSDLRQRLLQEKETVECCQRAVSGLQGQVWSALETLDGSAQQEKAAVKKRVEAVVEWAKISGRLREKRIQDLQQQYQKKMETLLDSLEHQSLYLQQLASAMTDALKEGASSERVATVLLDYQDRHKQRLPTHQELSKTLAAHSFVLRHTASSPDLCQAAVESYMGCPLATRVVKGLPSPFHWSFSSRVQRSEGGSDRVVTDLMPLKDGTLCVIYQEAVRSGAAAMSRLVYYSPDGIKRWEQVLGVGEVVMLEPAHCQLALFSVSSETWQCGADTGPCSPEDPEGKVPSVVFLKGDETVTRVWEVTCPLLGHSRTSSVLAELEEAEAIKVKASAGGHYLAVLTSRQQVAVFQRYTSLPLATFDVTSQLQQAELRDMCFGQIQQRELLLMAEGFYSVILLVDHLKGCVLTAFLPSPLPRPTCMQADDQGQLWVGGEEGEVVVGVLLPPSLKDKNNPEEGAEGYLLPCSDQYVNLRQLLGPKLPSSHHPPSEAPPPPHQPLLPPRPRANKVIDTNCLGMPLTPPAPPPPPRTTASLKKSLPSPASDQVFFNRPLSVAPEKVVRPVHPKFTQQVSLPSRLDDGSCVVPRPGAGRQNSYDNVDRQALQRGVESGSAKYYTALLLPPGAGEESSYEDLGRQPLHRHGEPGSPQSRAAPPPVPAAGRQTNYENMDRQLPHRHADSGSQKAPTAPPRHHSAGRQTNYENMDRQPDDSGSKPDRPDTRTTQPPRPDARRYSDYDDVECQPAASDGGPGSVKLRPSPFSPPAADEQNIYENTDRQCLHMDGDPGSLKPHTALPPMPGAAKESFYENTSRQPKKGDPGGVDPHTPPPPVPAAPQSDYENMNRQPGSEHLKCHPAPPPLPEAASHGHPKRHSWKPYMMMESPKKFPTPAKQPPKAPPKSVGQQPKVPPKNVTVTQTTPNL